MALNCSGYHACRQTLTILMVVLNAHLVEMFQHVVFIGFAMDPSRAESPSLQFTALVPSRRTLLVWTWSSVKLKACSGPKCWHNPTPSCFRRYVIVLYDLNIGTLLIFLLLHTGLHAIPQDLQAGRTRLCALRRNGTQA